MKKRQRGERSLFHFIAIDLWGDGHSPYCVACMKPVDQCFYWGRR